ncbi:MAG: UDP-3-O-(3-hydroxymyristoyl)glucosamine N-acyltransferase [Bacteriovoracaceae bacterium]|nr:UDP-3-O-(3-hydroxymyristoyl)glucosamine N-acyltransferase [Bacteriovoracaceae bacterium]
MKITDFSFFDCHLVFGQHFQGEIRGISSPEKPLKDHLVFIKNTKILNDFLSSKINSKETSLILIVSSSLWLKEQERITSFLKDRESSVYSTESIEFCLIKFSKFFHDKKMQFDSTVDGRQNKTAKIHPTAQIAQDVFIGDSVVIQAHVKILTGAVVMAHSSIDENSIIFPHVVIYPFVQVGKNCRIHAGTVLGADGFGYHFAKGEHHKIWHYAGVILEDHIEIGACSAVDAGTFSPTTIGQGTKLDNHVQIGHNCKIGKHVVICGHTAIGGSSIIEDFCVFGGKSGMGHSMKVGKGSQIGGGALVNSDLPEGSIVSGYPARPLKEWLRGLAYVRIQSSQNKKEDKKRGDSL